jgi:hypothetical protein
VDRLMGRCGKKEKKIIPSLKTKILDACLHLIENIV